MNCPEMFACITNRVKLGACLPERFLMNRLSKRALLVIPLFVIFAFASAVLANALRVNAEADKVDAILREIAANHWHGLEDDAVQFEPEQLDQVFHTRKLSAQCFAVSNYAVWRLRQEGFRARNIALINVHPEIWNGTQDAHNIIEVWHPRYGQWVVVDLLFNRMYPETAVDFLQERVTPIMLADDPYSNPVDFDEQLPEPETWEFGYPRLAQLMIIETEGWWYGDASAKAAADEFNERTGTPFRYRADFMEWAYGSPDAAGGS